MSANSALIGVLSEDSCSGQISGSCKDHTKASNFSCVNWVNGSEHRQL